MKPIQENDIWALLGSKQEDLFFRVHPELIKTVTEVRMEKVKCPGCNEDSLDAWIYKCSNGDWLQDEVWSICHECQQYAQSKLVTKRMQQKRQNIIDGDWYHISEEDQSGFKNFEITNDSVGVAKTKAEEYTRVIQSGEKRNLRIVGTTGTGKTHLAIAIARTIKHKGYSVAFIEASQLFNNIKNTFGNEVALKRFEEQLATFDLVVIDDVGVETKKANEISWTSSEWVRIVELRKGKSTVYTTNFDEKALAGVIGARAESRMSENSMLIEIFTPDEDYRKDKLFY